LPDAESVFDVMTFRIAGRGVERAARDGANQWINGGARVVPRRLCQAEPGTSGAMAGKNCKNVQIGSTVRAVPAFAGDDALHDARHGCLVAWSQLMMPD
jgi:hypothetical protein